MHESHRSHQQTCDFRLPAHGGVSRAIHRVFEEATSYTSDLRNTGGNSTAMHEVCSKDTDEHDTVGDWWVFSSHTVLVKKSVCAHQCQKKLRTTQRWHCCKELSDQRPHWSSTDFLCNVTAALICADFVTFVVVHPCCCPPIAL